MVNDHEESHVVIQAWRFDLDAKDERYVNQLQNNQEKKNHKKTSKNDTIFENEIYALLYNDKLSKISRILKL
jgi:hypothetical protein